MRVALVALNAKYTHTSLSIACLASACEAGECTVMVREYTINQHSSDILADIYGIRADVLCFSCYIWNIEIILRLVREYKSIVPETRIILGGPEVSYNAGEILRNYPDIDYIVRGEGERSLPDLLGKLYREESPGNLDGITFWHHGNVIENPDRKPVQDLDQLPRPAYNCLHDLENRVIYYESSRGCPFQCGYCLSSLEHSLRLHSMARIQKDLHYLLEQGIRAIKFVDRTFNASESRALEIMKYLLAQSDEVRCHFEIRAELISDEFIDFLKIVPAQRFYFEIGIQSTNPDTLEAVKRKSNWDIAGDRIRRIRQETQVHLHLDLIAGLPHEDYGRFKTSFNDVMSLRPHVLQLGFLKLLKGSPLEADCGLYGYTAQQHPPYEILKAEHISYEQIVMLHRVEDLLERYFNSNVFSHTIAFAVDEIYEGEYFDFFEELACFWIENNHFNRAHKRSAEYSLLADFFRHRHPGSRYNEFIKLDYLLFQGPHRIPDLIERNDSGQISEKLYSLLKDDEFVKKHIPDMRHLQPGERRRRVHLEYMNIDPNNGKDCHNLPVIFVYPKGSQLAQKTICLYDDQDHQL